MFILCPKISVTWNESDGGFHKIRSGLSYSGRGMELSTLNVYNGKLYSCDDKTGVVYELRKNPPSNDFFPTPWAILANGNYTGTKGFIHHVIYGI